MCTLEAFLRVFHKKYFSKSMREKREAEFLNLEQGGMTVAQYKARFTQLVCFASLIVYDDNSRARRFEMGLRPAIRACLTALRMRNYAELVDHAMLVEKDCDNFARV